MESIWKRDVSMPEFPALEGEARADVLVIGGGITGILCAHALREAGADVLLVEAGRLCGGVTGNTTAKLTIQHGLFADKLLGLLGEERGGMYLSLQQEALGRWRTLCEKIPCDFEERDSFVYSLSDREKLRREVRALERLGVPAVLTETPRLPFPTAGAVKVPGQAQFHPLKLLSALVKDLRVFENTRVLSLSPNMAKTARGAVRAERILVAAHSPFINRHGSYFLKLYQQRSAVIALKNAPNLDGMYVDEKDGGLSFRNFGDLLLLGGGSKRTGKPRGGWQALSLYARSFYPRSEVVVRWAAQDCMTLDGLPYIGQYSKNTPGLYVATGFGKWGMTSSMAAAIVLREMILGRDDPRFAVVSPSRSILRPQLLVNGFEAVTHLLKPTVPRCPHMGCALRWNPEERTWECPCHGSRFSENGQVLDGPANRSLRHRT